MDLMYLPFILIMIVVFSVIIWLVVQEYNNNIGTDIDAEFKQPVNDYIERAPNVLQGLFMIVLVGVSIIALASAFFVDSHPIFYGFWMIILAFLAWINATYANLWFDFRTDTALAGITAQLPVINTVIRWYPLTMFIIGVVIGVVMFSKAD